tara:strand:- start:26611 stop:26787 length:177 start_codon:yes stop_codon:yes gene_type:complete
MDNQDKTVNEICHKVIQSKPTTTELNKQISINIYYKMASQQTDYENEKHAVGFILGYN